jgi:hypothetical protein
MCLRDNTIRADVAAALCSHLAACHIAAKLRSNMDLPHAHNGDVGQTELDPHLEVLSMVHRPDLCGNLIAGGGALGHHIMALSLP